jgi:hypothetical protein
MLSNTLREKNFNVRQLSHAVRHKAHGHAFGLRVKADARQKAIAADNAAED